MGFIYSGLNNVNGFSSRACVGRVDENGFIYNNINNVNGFTSRACVGRVDRNGYVYNGQNNVNGFTSRACIGRVDENGYVYNGINNVNGFTSRACVGRVDENGYVYNGINNVNGFASRACIGRVDNDSQRRAAGAALLLNLSRNTTPVDVIPEAGNSGGGGISVPPIGGTVSGGTSIWDFLPSLPGLIAKILMLIFFAVPIAAILLGFYLPYDVFLGSDELGFGEYGPILVFSYGISLIPLGMSFVDTLFTGEYRAAEYLIPMYAIPVILLVSGCLEEGRIGSALLSFIPALMLFVFPAVVCLILNGLACLISNLFCIDDMLDIADYCFILTLIVSIVLSIICGIKLGDMPDATVNSINETFGIEARVQEGPLYTSVPVGEENYVVSQREKIKFLGEITKDDQKQFYYYTIPKTGNYRFEIDDCSFEVALRIYDGKGNCIASANHCSNGKGTRVLGLIEGQEISIEAHNVGGFTKYSILVIEDVDISGYASITDHLMYPKQMNSYLFTPSVDGGYMFEIDSSGDAKYDVYIKNTNGESKLKREECTGKTILEVYNLVSGKPYILDIVGYGELEYTMNISYQRPNSYSDGITDETYAGDISTKEEIETAVAEGYTIEQREVARFDGVTSYENRENEHYFTVPVTGEYRYEFYDTYGDQATLEIYDDNNKRLFRQSYCFEGASIRGPELHEGDKIKLVVSACVGYPSYSLLVIRDMEISGYPSISDHIDYSEQWNVYDFTAPYDGSYRFEFVGNLAPFDIFIIDKPDKVVTRKENCVDGDYTIAKNLIAGRTYKVKIVGHRQGDYSLKYYQCGTN